MNLWALHDAQNSGARQRRNPPGTALPRGITAAGHPWGGGPRHCGRLATAREPVRDAVPLRQVASPWPRAGRRYPVRSPCECRRHGRARCGGGRGPRRSAPCSPAGRSVSGRLNDLSGCLPCGLSRVLAASLESRGAGGGHHVPAGGAHPVCPSAPTAPDIRRVRHVPACPHTRIRLVGTGRTPAPQQMLISDPAP